MDGRLLSSSRGRIVQLLRRAARSVNELASALGLTDNAVRAHLARLEGDGLVQQIGSRQSFRKPENIYDITPEAERLFAKAYVPVLATLLASLESRLDQKEFDAYLREVGQRLAAPYKASMAGLSPEERAQKTLQILQDLGGLAALEESEGKLFVRGFGCPLSQVVTAQPKLCLVAQVLVSELLGREVLEQCQRGDRPKCCFAVV